MLWLEIVAPAKVVNITEFEVCLKKKYNFNWQRPEHIFFIKIFTEEQKSNYCQIHSVSLQYLIL